MHLCDLNCDLGEGFGNDEAIMPYISSANIACGYHAGDKETMKRTVELCLQYNVAIGAHPSFFDPQNFGRVEMPCTPEEVYKLVKEQVTALQEIAAGYNATLQHVKPHGALYNMAAREVRLAKAIAQAVKDMDKGLIVVGLSGSSSVKEAERMGLQTANEVFADRTYQADGSLTPRTKKNALIETEEAAVAQVLSMVQKGKVQTTEGKEIPIQAETVCIHGDGKNAVAFARKINETLKRENIVIRPKGGKGIG
jgi:5-oxoprolinase (ATP-hydrolysing) subunit A